MEGRTNRDELAQAVDILHLKWIQRMMARLDSGEITSTEMATLYRYFSEHDYAIGRGAGGQKPEDLMTTPELKFDPDEFDTDHPF